MTMSKPWRAALLQKIEEQIVSPFMQILWCKVMTSVQTARSILTRGVVLRRRHYANIPFLSLGHPTGVKKIVSREKRNERWTKESNYPQTSQDFHKGLIALRHHSLWCVTGKKTSTRKLVLGINFNSCFEGMPRTKNDDDGFYSILQRSIRTNWKSISAPIYI